ncbi:MAG TPA: DUF3556 domain-containing protein [Polyangiaceae bacterium]|nr:DUF3556 domain-containing protein [Polyangiaceae bacterium]
MFLKPLLPPYDPLEWEKQPFEQKSRMVCQAWALQGYGAPLAVYLAYALKVLLYIGGWLFFCSLDPAKPVAELSSWWLEPVAFQKAILWSALFEILGMGCGSGPMTGRYWPPIGGALYFLRPGTTKLPLFPGAPVIGGIRRNALDALLYAGTLALFVGALSSDEPPRSLFVGLALSIAALGVLDKTLFLCVRGEHYWTTIAIFALATDFVPGAKAVHTALWFWAGFSKLNHHFPAVVGVMTSNGPFTRFAWLRRRMYRDYPNDLNPSQLATYLAHAGTLLELSVPVVLLAGNGGTVTLVGLVLMLLLHTFITSNVPMGVPIEWNFMMVHGAFFLFWKNADVSVLSMSLPVAALVGLVCVVLPLLGNFFPARVPFLLAMRYYAGNWAYSVWLFRGNSHERLDRLTKSSGWVYDQLVGMYDRATMVAMTSKAMAFRLMHLHGRVLPPLVERAAPNFSEYQWVEGELVAGIVLGWNFGDGHLHREQLLSAVQQQCHFEEGELRCIMVESQPLGKGTLHYRILDAKTGLLEQGLVEISTLRARQPWGETAA